MLSSSSRLLWVLSLLQTRSHWAGPELAERLAVHPRTLRRDIDRLRQLGYPIHASSGLGRWHQPHHGNALDEQAASFKRQSGFLWLFIRRVSSVSAEAW